jgi:hypothetical protein
MLDRCCLVCIASCCLFHVRRRCLSFQAPRKEAVMMRSLVIRVALALLVLQAALAPAQA